MLNKMNSSHASSEFSYTLAPKSTTYPGHISMNNLIEWDVRRINRAWFPNCTEKTMLHLNDGIVYFEKTNKNMYTKINNPGATMPMLGESLKDVVKLH